MTVASGAASINARILAGVLDRAGSGETGSARLAQVGFLALLHNLHLRGIQATTKTIEEITGADRRGIYEVARALEAKGLVTISSITNRHNKGRVFQFALAQHLVS